MVTMTKGLESLIKANNSNVKAISNLQHAIAKANLDADLSESESSNLLDDNFYDAYGVRKRLKSSSKKTKKGVGGNSDHPSLRQSGLPSRRDS